jgi:hypothetical protein
VGLCFCPFMTLFILDLSFLFLSLYPEIGSKNFKDGKHISCDHPQI